MHNIGVLSANATTTTPLSAMFIVSVTVLSLPSRGVRSSTPWDGCDGGFRTRSGLNLYLSKGVSGWGASMGA